MCLRAQMPGGKEGMIPPSLGARQQLAMIPYVATTLVPLWTDVGGTPLNLWEVLQKGGKPCGQGVMRTPHHGVFS